MQCTQCPLLASKLGSYSYPSAMPLAIRSNATRMGRDDGHRRQRIHTMVAAKRTGQRRRSSNFIASYTCLSKRSSNLCDKPFRAILQQLSGQYPSYSWTCNHTPRYPVKSFEAGLTVHFLMRLYSHCPGARVEPLYCCHEPRSDRRRA